MGRWIFSGSGDETVRVWDGETGTEVAKLTKDRPIDSAWVYGVALTGGDRMVIVNVVDGVRAWEWQSGGVRWLRRESYGGGSIGVTPDGRSAIVCAGSRVEALDIATGEVIKPGTTTPPASSPWR